MYSQFKSCVRTSDGTSEYFRQENGVLQGKAYRQLYLLST